MMAKAPAVLLGLSALVPLAASAATITRTTEDGHPVITVRGEALRGDAVTFAKLIETGPPDPKTVVDLSGPGGIVGDGVRIGILIHTLGWTTRVGDGRACYSTCAYTWIAGAHRLMSSDAHLAFHAPYDRKTFLVTDSGRHLMTAYAKAVGLNERTLAFVMAKAPGEGYDWLDASKAKAIGLDVEIVPATKKQAGHFSTATVDAVEGAERDRRTGGDEAVMKDIEACYAGYRRLRSDDKGLQCFALEAAAIMMARKQAAPRRPARRFTVAAAIRRLSAALVATGHDRRSSQRLMTRWMADLHATAQR